MSSKRINNNLNLIDMKILVEAQKEVKTLNGNDFEELKYEEPTNIHKISNENFLLAMYCKHPDSKYGKWKLKKCKEEKEITTVVKIINAFLLTKDMKKVAKDNNVPYRLVNKLLSEVIKRKLLYICNIK